MTPRQVLRRIKSEKFSLQLLEETECGPFDGGCLAVAMVIHRLLGGELVSLVSCWGISQHAAVHLPDGTYMDAAGIFPNAEELISNFNRNELANCVEIRPLSLKIDLKEAPHSSASLSRLIACI